MSVCVQVCMSVFMCMRVYVCMSVYMYECVCDESVCVYEDVYLCMNVCV